MYWIPNGPGKLVCVCVFFEISDFLVFNVTTRIWWNNVTSLDTRGRFTCHRHYPEELSSIHMPWHEIGNCFFEYSTTPSWRLEGVCEDCLLSFYLPGYKGVPFDFDVLIDKEERYIPLWMLRSLHHTEYLPCESNVLKHQWNKMAKHLSGEPTRSPLNTGFKKCAVWVT